ncbi:hypothetical protein GCM10008179_16170 [Hansschlegelia plantiphila]|uniref:Secreted protein n=1 Tax=Hansschlegelia plantiphila TaxID=374655 RepID=A0A9W6J2A2_9HYPH|nr:hypothetical protein GCM10008179_16170 [Hansschlegelia plantiphila]
MLASFVTAGIAVSSVRAALTSAAGLATTVQRPCQLMECVNPRDNSQKPFNNAFNKPSCVGLRGRRTASHAHKTSDLLFKTQAPWTEMETDNPARPLPYPDFPA